MFIPITIQLSIDQNPITIKHDEVEKQRISLFVDHGCIDFVRGDFFHSEIGGIMASGLCNFGTLIH